VIRGVHAGAHAPSWRETEIVTGVVDVRFWTAEFSRRSRMEPRARFGEGHRESRLRSVRWNNVHVWLMRQDCQLLRCFSATHVDDSWPLQKPVFTPVVAAQVTSECACASSMMNNYSRRAVAPLVSG
jgi:hypothetical protein